jgi:hypothetical protein
MLVTDFSTTTLLATAPTVCVSLSAFISAEGQQINVTAAPTALERDVKLVQIIRKLQTWDRHSTVAWRTAEVQQGY